MYLSVYKVRLNKIIELLRNWFDIFSRFNTPMRKPNKYGSLTHY